VEPLRTWCPTRERRRCVWLYVCVSLPGHTGAVCEFTISKHCYISSIIDLKIVFCKYKGHYLYLLYCFRYRLPGSKCTRNPTLLFPSLTYNKWVNAECKLVWIYIFIIFNFILLYIFFSRCVRNQTNYLPITVHLGSTPWLQLPGGQQAGISFIFGAKVKRNKV